MGDVFPRLRLAAVQAAPVWLNREATVEKAADLIREAGAGGAEFIGFPENFIPGHPVWLYYHPATSPKSLDFAVELYKNSVEIPSPETDALCHAAADAGAFVVMGLTEKRPGETGTLFNTQLFIDRSGRIVGKHQKLVPTGSERVVHTGGSGRLLRTFPSEFGPVSGLCCGENRNPMAVSVIAAAYTRIHVACWPNHSIPGFFAGGGGLCESSLLASRNIANMCKCFVISACATNSPEMAEVLPVTNEDREYLLDADNTGGSVILDPRGTIIAGPMHGGQEGILYADVDLDETIRGRLLHDFGGHYNRPDVLSLFVDDSAQELVTRVGKPVAPPARAQRGLAGPSDHADGELARLGAAAADKLEQPDEPSLPRAITTGEERTGTGEPENAGPS